MASQWKRAAPRFAMLDVMWDHFSAYSVAAVARLSATEFMSACCDDFFTRIHRHVNLVNICGQLCAIAIWIIQNVARYYIKKRPRLDGAFLRGISHDERTFSILRFTADDAFIKIMRKAL